MLIIFIIQFFIQFSFLICFRNSELKISNSEIRILKLEFHIEKFEIQKPEFRNEKSEFSLKNFQNSELTRVNSDF